MYVEEMGYFLQEGLKAALREENHMDMPELKPGDIVIAGGDLCIIVAKNYRASGVEWLVSDIHTGAGKGVKPDDITAIYEFNGNLEMESGEYMHTQRTQWSVMTDPPVKLTADTLSIGYNLIWQRPTRPESYKERLRDAIDKMGKRAKAIEGDNECQNAFCWGCADGLKHALKLLEESEHD